jgi:hypothetical protein
LSALQVSANFAVQIEASPLPISLHGSLGDIPQRGDFNEGETAEEFQVYDLG